MISTSPTVGKIAGALAEAQAAMQNVQKDAQNPHFRSNYATLAAVIDAIRPALAAHGIAYLQGTETERVTTTILVGKGDGQRAEMVDGMRVEVSTTFMHESGEWIESTIQTVVSSTAPQPIGSAISYLRRYALQSLAGVASVDADDDGEAARTHSAPTEKPADLGMLRLLVAALDLDPATVEAYCNTIGRPWGQLSATASARLVEACRPGQKFRADVEKFASEKKESAE